MNEIIEELELSLPEVSVQQKIKILEGARWMDIVTHLETIFGNRRIDGGR